jgi:hypothetical protein
MCPLRLLLTLLAAIGLMHVMGPTALVIAEAKSPRGKTRQSAAWDFQRVGIWLGSFLIIALHLDLLLSLGYAQSAFQFATNLQ